MFVPQSKSLAAFTYLLYSSFEIHDRLKDVTILQGKEIKAVGSDQVMVQVDGELIGNLPQEFRIQEDALTLIMPSDYQEKTLNLQ